MHIQLAFLSVLLGLLCGPPASGGQTLEAMDPRIWCIHQDRGGDLWLGSNGSGVYRYDGARFVRYGQADGLSGQQVRAIQEDAHGNVFVSTDEGVSKFDGKRFTTLEVVEAPDAESGWALRPDDVWIVFGAGKYGPCRYDGETLHRLKLSKSPAEDAFRAKYPEADYAPSGVYTIYADRRGHLWFGTASAGLCRYDGETLSWMYEEGLTTTPSGGAFGIRSIYEDRAGDFWICNTQQRFQVAGDAVLKGEYSLIQYKPKAGLPDAESATGRNFSFYSSMTEDADGALWMACGTDGVWKYADQGVTPYPVGEGAYAISIYRDRGGKLWVGTLEQGAFVFEGEGFASFQPRGRSK